jgi:hypothetical protein
MIEVAPRRTTVAGPIRHQPGSKPMATDSEVDDRDLQRIAFTMFATFLLARIMGEGLALSPDPDAELDRLRRELTKLAHTPPKHMDGFMATAALTGYIENHSERLLGHLSDLLSVRRQ